MSALDVLVALQCGRAGCACGAAAWRGEGSTHCPAHDDRRPSLSVTERGGRVLVHCHAGCGQRSVIDALHAAALWP